MGGHGGMDFIMDYRLIYCLRNGLPLTWMSTIWPNGAADSAVGDFCLTTALSRSRFPTLRAADGTVTIKWEFAL